MHAFTIKIKTFLHLMENKVGVKVNDKLIVIGLCCSLQKGIQGNVEKDVYIAKLFLLNVIFKLLKRLLLSSFC
jgi:hypothetical protein